MFKARKLSGAFEAGIVALLSMDFLKLVIHDCHLHLQERRQRDFACRSKYEGLVLFIAPGLQLLQAAGTSAVHGLSVEQGLFLAEHAPLLLC